MILVFHKSQAPKIIPNGISEVPDVYRPSEWLTEVLPRKAPYYPQMGDEIVYFRQGHQFYIDAVRNKKIYELGVRFEPWSKVKIRVRILKFSRTVLTLRIFRQLIHFFLLIRRRNS